MPKPVNRDGPGEQGKPVIIEPEFKKERDEKWKINEFNLMASDKIALNRSLPDVRPRGCNDKKYPGKLPTTSVIVVFHNEAWSTLLRTTHSIINRSPRELLMEVILVDDCSTQEHLKKPLDDYVAKLPVPVHVERMEVRSGLIRSRLRGGSVAKGDVLTYLDSHCECTEGWLEPLVSRIGDDSTCMYISETRMKVQVRNLETNMCLDTMMKEANNKVGMFGCHGQGGNQIWAYTNNLELKHDEICLDLANHRGPVMMLPCHGQGGNQQWHYDDFTKELKHSNSMCLEKPDAKQRDMPVVKPCNGSKGQQWTMVNMALMDPIK
ncbi:polypeptide N-acetylgalactosaminyltransferase 1-like [Saccoglossus kowalevskii]